MNVCMITIVSSPDRRNAYVRGESIYVLVHLI